MKLIILLSLLEPALFLAVALLSSSCRSTPPMTSAQRAEWDFAQRQHADAALALKILTTPYKP
jgi:multisubunit Na+/H+ antiporter MnhC subunit